MQEGQSLSHRRVNGVNSGFDGATVEPSRALYEALAGRQQVKENYSLGRQKKVDGGGFVCYKV
jgi:hypothetical protein